MVDELTKHTLEMATSEDDQPVETLATGALDPALCVTVRNGCLQWRTDNPHAFGSENVLDREGKLLVVVTDQERTASPRSSTRQLRFLTC